MCFLDFSLSIYDFLIINLLESTLASKWTASMSLWLVGSAPLSVELIRDVFFMNFVRSPPEILFRRKALLETPLFLFDCTGLKLPEDILDFLI
jgi:hypothetical protein